MHNGTCDHFQLCVYFTAPSNHLMHILQPTRCTQKFRTNMQMCNQSAYLKSHPTLISIYFICAKRTIFRWKLFLFPTMLTSNVFVIQAVNIKYILIDDTVRLKWNHIMAKYLDANWIRRSYCSRIMCSILMLRFNQIPFFNAHLFTFFFSFFYVNRLCQAQNVKLPLYAISSTTNQTKPRRFLNEFMMHVNHHEQQLDPVYIYISAPIVAANLYWTKTKMKEKLSQNRKSHKIEKIFLDSAISRECFGFKMEHILLQSKHANK